MSNSTGTLTPWGLVQGANFPGTRERYGAAHAQTEAASRRVYPGLGWQNFALGRVRSALDGIRAARKPATSQDPKGLTTTREIKVAGI